MPDYHYEICLILAPSGAPVGKGVEMKFRDTPTGADVTVTDNQGDPVALVTSEYSMTPRFVAPVAAGFLVDPVRNLAQRIPSLEQADSLDAATAAVAAAEALATNKADLSGANFTGPVTVPTATQNNQPVTKGQMDQALSGVTTGVAGHVATDDPDVFVLGG